MFNAFLILLNLFVLGVAFAVTMIVQTLPNVDHTVLSLFYIALLVIFYGNCMLLKK